MGHLQISSRLKVNLIGHVVNDPDLHAKSIEYIADLERASDKIEVFNRAEQQLTTSIDRHIQKIDAYLEVSDLDKALKCFRYLNQIYRQRDKLLIAQQKLKAQLLNIAELQDHPDPPPQVVRVTKRKRQKRPSKPSSVRVWKAVPSTNKTTFIAIAPTANSVVPEKSFTNAPAVLQTQTEAISAINFEDLDHKLLELLWKLFEREFQQTPLHGWWLELQNTQNSIEAFEHVRLEIRAVGYCVQCAARAEITSSKLHQLVAEFVQIGAAKINRRIAASKLGRRIRP